MNPLFYDSQQYCKKAFSFASILETQINPDNYTPEMVVFVNTGLTIIKVSYFQDMVFIITIPLDPLHASKELESWWRWRNTTTTK